MPPFAIKFRRTAGSLALGVLGVFAAMQLAYAVRGAWRWSHGDRTAPTALVHGDTLPPINLVRRGPGDPQTRRVSLRDVVTRSCSVLVFFNSASAQAHRMATDWREVSELRQGIAGAIPVFWVADERDTGAGEFIAKFDLARPWFTYATSVDRKRIGVIASPTLYLVARGGIFLESVDQRPDKVQPLPVECHTTATEP